MWETFSDLEKGSWHLGPNSLRGLSRGLRGSIPDASLWGLQCAVAWGRVVISHIVSPWLVGMWAGPCRGPDAGHTGGPRKCPWASR